MSCEDADFGKPQLRGEVTRLLMAMRNGEPDAEAKLFPLVYDELRKRAASYLRSERRDHTLQATALVHEAYLRLVDQHTPWQSRAHFFGVAAHLMRRILVDYARAHNAEMRGGGYEKISLNEGLRLSDAESPQFLDLNAALTRFEAHDGRRARVVELLFFGGLTIPEAADMLGVAPRTVVRDWAVARAWLNRELSGGVAG